MKRIIVLLCAAVLLALSLCACMNTSAGRVDDKATEASTLMTPTERDKTRDIADDKEHNVKPTEKGSDMMETIADIVATEWDEMVDDGEVEDGDGKVGDLENHDGDGNAAPEDE